ncbi:MAG TPA: transcriptional repressor [Ktedonobacterales bacterium]|nr:transcriptional repressor [Ktedonobacterales bacterium]
MRSSQGMTSGLPARAEDVGDTGARALAPHDNAVLAALRETACHPTAGEVYDAVRRRYPHMGRATVYRALQRLEAAGLAVEVGRDSLGRHYDARTDRHDHAICTECGRVLDILPGNDLPPDLLAGLTALARDAGVAVDTYEVRLYGRCAACREAQAAPARTRYPDPDTDMPTRGGANE